MQQSRDRTSFGARVSSLSGSLSRPAAVFVLALAIFLVDTVTDLEIAVAVFYVAVVLISVRSYQRRGVLAVSATCVLLTLISFLLTPGGSYSAGVVNTVISVTAIAATTYLALRMEEARMAMETAQAQLAHVARITVLGELTASIAHEINQPLAAVVTNGNACSRWLAAEPPNVDRAKAAVDGIVEDAIRASEVVARIRALANRAPAAKTPLDLNKLVMETIALARGEMQHNGVSLRTDLAEGLPPVRGDKVLLQQVILNLVTNAIDAMRHTSGRPHDLAIETAANDGDAVLVTVRDTGAGLDHEGGERLFDSFYTTKPEGMGMGLTISRSIIEAHGGRVWAEPGNPVGAVLRFTLPRDR